MKALYIVGAIVLVALVGAGGFYGGVVYAQSQTQNTAADFARLRGAGNGTEAAASGPCGFPQRTNGGTRQGSGQGSSGQVTSGQGSGQGGFQGNSQQLGNCVARGTIKSIDGSTIQISTPVSVVTVKVDGTTTITKTDTGTLSDLKTGDRVTVFSMQSGDSPTASMVQLQGMPGQTGQ
jgi:hypothetical protein